jgi:eukaryotic-like serine/threonine-protein kinase
MATGLLPSQLPENPQTGEVMFQDRTQISPGLAEILQKMIRYHYRDRYQSASEVLYDLQQLIVPTTIPQPLVYSNNLVGATPISTNPLSQPIPASTYPQAETITQSSLPLLSISGLNRTLSIVKFLPFAGGIGVYLFDSPTWIVLLGVGLTVFGVGLFFLRNWYPRFVRDYDAVCAAIFFISGIMLLFQEDSLKTEIQLSEFLIAGAGIFALSESLRQRSQK